MPNNAVTTMFQSKCEPLNSVEGVESVLLKNLTPAPTQMAMFDQGFIPAGRVFSINASTGNAELGVAGKRVGFINRRSTGNPSTGFYSDSAAMTAAPHVTFKTGMEIKVAMYALVQGMEFATTEYDATQVFALHDHLRAPDATVLSNNATSIKNLGGKLTNQTVAYGRDNVVGVVTKVPGVNEHNINVIHFFSMYAPPIDDLTSTLKTAINV